MLGEPALTSAAADSDAVLWQLPVRLTLGLANLKVGPVRKVELLNSKCTKGKHLTEKP